MRHLSTRLFVCTLILGLFAIFLPGEDAWQLAHDLGNRYEGPVDIATGNPPLDVLSFTGYLKAFEGTEEWRVRFFADVAQKVTVYARTVDNIVQYKMESKPQDAFAQSWTEFKKWDTGRVLVKLRVKPASIGITVQTSTGAYLPAIVYPAMMQVPPEIRQYRLLLRASRSVDRVDYAIDGVGQNGSRLTEQRTVTGRHEGGVAFPLDVDVSNFFKGQMALTLRLSGADLASSKELKFYHQPLTAN